jgi:muramoyltetrapeptide carboxypeptidase
MPSLLRPKALRPGDTVAIAALSGPLEEEEVPLLDRAIPAIEALGFHARLAPLVDRNRRHWWMAARPEEMAAEFNELLRDPEVRAIFALTGGRATLAYVDLIDFEAVRADPKPLLGFSDISTLDLAVHGQTGLVTIHSELATWGFGTWEELPEAQRQPLVDAYRRILTSDAPLGALPAAGEWETWRPGRAEGPLIGGLLNRILKIQATPFAVPLERFDGAIFFWEEVRAPTPTIWYDLHALRLAGILDRIAGMVVGTPTDMEIADGPDTLHEIVLDVLGDRDIPVLGNVDIGHSAANIPLPLGVRTELDADARTLSLLEGAVSGGAEQG